MSGVCWCQKDSCQKNHRNLTKTRRLIVTGMNGGKEKGGIINFLCLIDEKDYYSNVFPHYQSVIGLLGIAFL